MRESHKIIIMLLSFFVVVVEKMCVGHEKNSRKKCSNLVLQLYNDIHSMLFFMYQCLSPKENHVVFMCICCRKKELKK